MKTLAITGASRGLGAVMARRAMESGYRVVGLARTPPEDPGFEFHACDVSDEESVKRVLGGVCRDPDFYGLINAAGIASMNLCIATPPATVRRIVDVNLLGTIFCSQVAGKALARRRRGRIVNFSTIAVALALKGEAVYAASKAGVEAFSRAFAREMADFDVTVNTIAPGPVDTDLIAKVPAQDIQRVVERQIIQRKGQPSDVWNVASLLLSPEAGMITGAVLNVGGA